MRKRQPFSSLQSAALALILWSILVGGSVSACIVVHEGYDEARAKSNLIILGTVISAGEGIPTFSSVMYEYRLRVQSVLVGELRSSEIDVIYDDLKAHRRGDVTVCPRLVSSGIEDSLDKGVVYKILLRTKNETDPAWLVRAEIASVPTEQPSPNQPIQTDVE